MVKMVVHGKAAEAESMAPRRDRMMKHIALMGHGFLYSAQGLHLAYDEGAGAAPMARQEVAPG